MKIKTLAIAAATLAVGAITSQAQVYSQNIVGYVNVQLVPGYNLIANPLDDGNGNQLTNLLASANLVNRCQLLTWGGTVYNSPINKSGSVVPTAWAANATLPPGTGFFIKNVGTVTTNTFTGSLYDPAGQGAGDIVTNTINPGYNLLASITPFAGDITTDTTNLTLNTATLVNRCQLLGWDPVGQTFLSPININASGVWASHMNVAVGQGFFLKSVNTTSTNWTQIIP